MALTSTVASTTLRYALPLGTLALPAIAYTALSATPTFGTLVLLLSLWQLNATIIIPRKQFAYGFLQTILVAIAIGLAHAGPAMGALSTPSISVIIMSGFSLITTMIAQLTIVAAYYTSRFVSAPWARITFFPALWATVWGNIARISPVGRLITWSPVIGLGPYSWIRPVFGQWGLDWITAAWAVVLTELAGSLIVGNSDGSDEPIPPLRGNLLSDDDEEMGGGEPPLGGIVSQCLNSLSSWRVLGLTALLVVLAVPSTLSSSLPLPLVAPNVTPIGVACVLPDTSRSGHYGGPPTLDDYIEKSVDLQKNAEIILWPEGAVRFDTPIQKQEAFDKIRNKTQGQKYWGVAFEEHVFADSPDGIWKAGMRRNGLVVLTQRGSVFEYYKRKLVPIAESFGMNPSSAPPEIYDIPVRKPNNWNSSDWSSLPDFKRPVPFTGSICLDFASPSSFTELESRPALILAPARTWHIDVGYAMWEQARARAEELGSYVLWCDGGAGGVSGIAGPGMHEVVQVGQGPWSRKIGIPWPFDRRRTLFVAGGEFLPFLAAWGIMGVGWAVELAVLKLATGDKEKGGHFDLFGRVRQLREMVSQWRIGARSDEERPLLE